MNNLETKVNDLDVAKLKTVPTDSKRLSGVIDRKKDKGK